jgi:hypothetical protein
MTSVLNVDSIAAKNGTSPVTLTKQAATKAFANMNGTGTIAFRDSLNASSLTDHSAGIYTTSWTNSFADTEYATTTATNLDQAYSGDMCIVTQATGSLKHKTYYGSGHAGTDASINCHTNFGDLA